MNSFITKSFFFPLLILFLFLNGKKLFADDVITAQKSDQGITITFTPQEWQINQETIDGKLYYKIDFRNSSFDLSAGNPQVPKRTVVIGIPFGAKVNLEILEIRTKKTISGRILPVPRILGESLGKIEYQEDANIYQSDQYFPGQIAEISFPKIMRDQQVVILNLCPVRFEPKNEVFNLFERLLVRVNFIGGKKQSDNAVKFKNARLYEQVLINPGQSAKWRKIHKRITKRLKANYWGDFYKIYVNENGIYKVTGSDLRNAGLDLNNVNPNTLKIYNNGGFQLPHNVDAPRSDSLIENTIIVEDGGDGTFETDDYILFYGTSVMGWKFNQDSSRFVHYLHPYARENVYWLGWQDLSPGKRVQSRSVFGSLPAVNITNFLDHDFKENEYKNLLNSGTCWLGNYFSSEARQRIYQFNLKGAVPNKRATIRLKLAGISNNYHRFTCYCNDLFVGSVPAFYGSGGNDINIREKYFAAEINSGLVDGYNKIKIEYQPKNDVSLAYMDWIELDFYRQLNAIDNSLEFYSPDSTGVFNYSIQSFSTDDIFVFDVSKFNEITRIKNTQISNGSVEFVDTTSSDIPKKYLATCPQKFKSPLNIEKDAPSQWHNWEGGADFIIITFDDFYDAVLPLKSLRENCDSLKTVVVKISDVFDEFACGLKDPTAIRDFIKYAFDNWQPKPSYVLLFGDGDYDYKNFISPLDPNWIPPFETSDLNENSSRARDDWFVCVSGNDNLMDLAIGRIPVRNFDQALNTVKKIINYKNDPPLGEWCNTITMVADDEFGHAGEYDTIDHVPDAENICENYIPKSFNVCKIYLTEYPAVRSASISGIRKPAATDALLKQINKGCVIVNYIGHANERLWAHERIINLSDDFPRINNGPKQAFWIAATCEFGKWDNPDFQSFAEKLVTVNERGAIAVFSSCRKANPIDNVSLNRKIYQQLFSGGKRPVRLGDAVMAAKNSRSNIRNDQFYHLLGDPTLHLTMPIFNVKINNYSPDSIRALTKMKVSGFVKNPLDSTTGFDGKILFSAYDSRKQRIYHVRDNKYYRYKLPGNSIFRGIVSLDNSEFLSQFIVPKDITYGGGDGRFSVFYWDNYNTGSGYVDRIPVGGTQSEFIDKQGPFIEIGFSGQDFLPGAFVSPNCELKITIKDEVSGVNIAGDIGHKIILTLDENEKIDLTDYFQYEQDSYTVGKILYPLANISEGSHQIVIKAWDNCNNSSVAGADFTVVSNDQLILRDLLNYPNPFSTNTEITFWINQDCDVCIKIYTLSGRLIRAMDHLRAENGFNHFYWDGMDQDQDPLANGVYLYKVSASRLNGNQKIFTHEIQKCVIVR